MRLFEILTAIGLLGLLIGWAWPSTKNSPIFKSLGVVVVVSILLHLVFEGARWQMTPMYVLGTIFLVSIVWNRLQPSTSNAGNRKKTLRILGTLCGLLLLAVGTAAGVLFPIPNLPTPSGKYAVGTTSFAFTDNSRSETFTPAPDDKRLVYVQVWYPASSTANSPRTRMWIAPEKVTPLLAKALHMPDFLFSHLAMVKANSYLNAPLSEQETSYPILVFSHGYDLGFFAQNTVQMEELASHGYVVFSIGHTYEGAIVLDTHGRAVPVSETQINAFYEESIKNVPLQKQALSTSGAEQIQAVRAFLDASPIMQASVQIWTQDTQFVLTQIEQMNIGQVDSPFDGHLDTSRIGVFGMSFGGATAAQVCAIDSRCKAALNMDGFQYGTLLDEQLKVPFLMMYSETAPGMNDFVLDNMTGGGARLVVKDTAHFNYTDFNFVSPLFQSLGVLGKINPQRMEHIMNAYLLAFFDQTLKGIPSPLLQGVSSDYPEVELKVYSAPPK